MNQPIRLARFAPILAALFLGSAPADELVIVLQNGKTIVLDTAEIRSMTFSNAHRGDTIRLVPSPKNFTPETRPPGGGSVTVRPVQGRDGNLAVSVSLLNVLPNLRYQLFVFVDGRNHGQPTMIVTDRGGNGFCSGEFRLPPGERVVSFSISEHNSDTDIYVSPGIYENQGLTVRIPSP